MSSKWSISALADAIFALATEGQQFHGSTSPCFRSGLRNFTSPTNSHAISSEKESAFLLQVCFQIGCTTSTLAPTRSRRSYLRFSSPYMFLYDLPHIPQSHEPYEYYDFFLLWWMYMANPGRSSMAPSCTCWFTRLCRWQIHKRMWMCSGLMSSACTRNSTFLTSSVPSRWQCSAPKVEIRILRIGDSESTWVLESSIYFNLNVLCGLLSSSLWWYFTIPFESWTFQSISVLESSVVFWIILLICFRSARGRWNKAQRDSRNHKGVWEGAACHLDHLLEPWGQDTPACGFVLADRKQKWRDFEPAPFGLRPSRRRACSLIL